MAFLAIKTNGLQKGQQLIMQVVELTGLTRFRAEEILRKAQRKK